MSAQRAQETNIANQIISFSIIPTGLKYSAQNSPILPFLHTWNNCEFIVAF